MEHNMFHIMEHHQSEIVADVWQPAPFKLGWLDWLDPATWQLVIWQAMTSGVPKCGHFGKF
jgi:hypothetical protein